MEQNDWRLGGQDRYLKGVTLLRRAYTRYREGWDHDHCAFCWAKFMVEDGPACCTKLSGGDRSKRVARSLRAIRLGAYASRGRLHV